MLIKMTKEIQLAQAMVKHATSGNVQMSDQVAGILAVMLVK